MLRPFSKLTCESKNQGIKNLEAKLTGLREKVQLREETASLISWVVNEEFFKVHRIIILCEVLVLKYISNFPHSSDESTPANYGGSAEMGRASAESAVMSSKPSGYVCT